MQPARPSAAEGLIEVPSGRVTTAFFRFDSVIPVGFWGWGRSTSTESEPGESELWLPDCTLTEGSKGTALQPVAPTGVVEVRFSTAPFCHELACRAVSTGPVHEVGLERNGNTGPWNGQSTVGSWSARHGPRSASWPGSPGTPQKVRLVPVSGSAWEMLGMVTESPPSLRTEALT